MRRSTYRDGKRTAWSGKDCPRRFLSSTVSPEPPLPKGEAPHCGSSKARSLPDNFPEKGRRQGRRLRVLEYLSAAGDNALEN